LQRQKRSTDQNAVAISEVAAPRRRRSTRALWAGTAAALAAIIAAGYWAFSSPGPPKLTETDTIVLSDFTNTTGDAVFDDALRQGLIVQLKQSPFLHILPDQRVRRVIAMMGLRADARLTPAVALKVCERSNGAAIVEGSIASLGNQYVLGLRATDCRSGDVLDTQQSQVPGKENVLGALSGMARAFRARVGESLATIQTHEKPLEEATTASLEALKAYSATRAPGSVDATPGFRCSSARSRSIPSSPWPTPVWARVTAGPVGGSWRFRAQLAPTSCVTERPTRIDSSSNTRTTAT
jgi:hypothetical protein